MTLIWWLFFLHFFNAIYSTGDASLIPQRTPKTKSHSRVIRQKKKAVLGLNSDFKAAANMVKQ